MKSWLPILICALLLGLGGAATFGAEKPNVLFIAIDDLRNDIGALGAAHAKTPEMDRFARTARVFRRHYTQVPTCGASRYSLLSGRYPSRAAHVGNNAIRDTHAGWADESLPGVFKKAGYRTLALGKISHYPGGMTGAGWAGEPAEMPGVWDRCWVPESPWATPLAMMHGYANGKPRQPGKSRPWEAFDGPDKAYPDAWVAEEAIATLNELAGQGKPWFFSVGFFKPHLPFAAPKKWFDLHEESVRALDPAAAAKPAWPSGWHGSGEFRGNYAPEKNPDTDHEYAQHLRRAYAATVSYVDAQVGRVLEALEEAGLEKNTVVVIWGDHGFLLGEHSIWGKHCLYEDALRSPLLIRAPDLEKEGTVSDAVVESVDIMPTLLDLCGLKAPEELDGRSLRAQLKDPEAPSSKAAHGFWTRGQRTIRTDQWRLIVHPSRNGVVELFDYRNDPQETRNHAGAHPEVVRELKGKLARTTSF